MSENKKKVKRRSLEEINAAAETRAAMDSPKCCRPERPRFWASAEDLNHIVQKATRKATWDFVEALGDTIKEKYDHLYVRVHQETEGLVRSGVNGYFWIATSLEIASIFEVATAGFSPTPSWRWEGQVHEFFNEQVPLGLGTVADVGTVNGKWRLIKCDKLPKHILIIGANNQQEADDNYFVLELKNYVL